MKIRCAILMMLLAGCATGPETKPAEVAAAPSKWEGDRNIATTLRAIRARVKRGEGDQVRAELLEQSRKRPGDVRLKMYVAWSGSPSEESWQEIHKLAMLNSEDPWLWTVSGLIYLQWRGFVDQAEGEFDKALKMKSGFLPAQVGQADVLRARGKYPEAKAAYEAALAQAPEWQEALTGLGLTLVALNDPAARPTLERALKIDSDDHVAVVALAKLAMEAKDTDLAIDLYKKMLSFSPRDRDGHLALAKLIEGKGDTAGAAAEYEAAMAIAPDVATARTLASAYQTLNRPDDELKALEIVAKFDPKDPAPLLRTADLRKAQKDNEAAEQALRQASERKPDDAGILLAVARQVRENGELIPCIEAYRAAKAAGAAEAEAELKEAEAKAGLDDKVITGNVQRVYEQVFARLKKQFDERKKANAALGGRLKVKVAISPEGKATAVEMLEDTIHDEVLAAAVYFGLKDAAYAKEKRTPTFEFVVTAGK